MKTLIKIQAVLAVLLLSNSINAQILTPAKWSYSVSKTEVNVGDIVELTFKAKLDPTWYIYSTDQDPDLGPMPAVFEFEKDASYKLVGDITPIGVKEKYDEIWDGNVRILEKEAIFKQKIKVLSKDLNVLVYLEYQVCTTADGKCVPGDEEFEIDMIKVN